MATNLNGEIISDTLPIEGRVVSSRHTKRYEVLVILGIGVGLSSFHEVVLRHQGVESDS